MLRSSIIGVVIGVIPGAGGDIACWLGYNEAKRWSKHPEEFGKGSPEGIAAPEAANNAITGGALIPLLTLGIPGDSGTAVMLGALMIQGMIPGPMLFVDQAVEVYTIIIGLFMANIWMGALGFAGLRWFARIPSVPASILMPLIFVFCFIGAYSLSGNVNDMYFMVVAGLVGYVLVKLEFSIPPVILGLILGNLVEKNLERSLQLSDGSFMIFLERPIALVLLVIAALSVCLPLVKYWRSLLLQSREAKRVAGSS
jgi:putative tricarboxylic transport membrane protein